jgi:hypothetical protein
MNFVPTCYEDSGSIFVISILVKFLDEPIVLASN